MTKLNEKLLHGAFIGDVDAMRHALLSGANIGALGAKGRGVLHFSVKSKKLGAVKLLIDSGADVNHADDDGTTPLHVSAGDGSLAIARLLIKHGADVGARNNDADAPIHLCVDNPSFVRLLINNGASANVYNRLGLTPLLEACKVNCAASIRLLCSAGADVDGISACHDDQDTALLVAARSGAVESVVELVNFGACVDARNSIGSNALHYAAYSNAALVAEFISDRMPPLIDDRNKYGFTPILVAATNNNVDVAMSLVNKGADVTEIKNCYPDFYESIKVAHERRELKSKALTISGSKESCIGL